MLCCSLAAISSSKASTMSVDKGDYYKDDYYKYEVRSTEQQTAGDSTHPP